MKSLGKKLILVSFIFALLAALSIFIYLKSLAAPKESIKKITILVAAEKIPARTEVNKKMLKEIQVPEDSIFEKYLKDYSQVLGKYTKETILKDEGFYKDKLLSDSGNENELSFNIEDNHRAVSLNVNGEAGVANLLKSGDYVDVVVYLPEKKEEQKIVRPDLAKMLLQNIKVLAVDKELYRVEQKEEEEKMPSTFLVTLSVPAADIEKLVLAEDIGNIKLVLRPLEKEDNNNSKGTTWQEISMIYPQKEEEVAKDNGGTSTPADTKLEEKKFSYYTVKKGDTLRSISRTHYGDPDKYKLIKEFNNIENENHIINGEVIKIPE